MSTSTLRPVAPAPRRAPCGAAQLLLVCVIVGVGAFEAMWFGVVTDTGLAVADPAVIAWVVTHRSPGLVAAARTVSAVGAPVVALTAIAMVIGWSVWRSRWRVAALGAAGIGVLILADVGMKTAVARARPAVAWQGESAQGYAFPSGHALLSAGVLLLLAWLVHRHELFPIGKRTRVALAVLSGCFVAAVGASRVVLAVHFPSDVFAAWSLAVFVVAVLGFVDTTWMRQVAT